MPAAEAQDPVALRSPALIGLLGGYLRLALGRRFHAVRLSGTLPDSLPADRPLVIYSNHPSWWDPAIFILLATRLFPGRPGYGPMERAALERYGVFRRIGVFGIEKHGAAGARRFLTVARRVLEAPPAAGGRGMLWVTAEGEFTDPRRRPVRLRAGIGHLARLVPDAVLVPLAIEYTFWNESRPEVLLRLGEPLAADPALRPAVWRARLEQALTLTMDRLALEAMRREPARFHLLLRGGVGLGGPYDVWRRFRATLAGRRFSPAHELDGERA